ncbi:hypothetical protein BKA70DRAFT_1337348 [Coprinopsis sp. MPI-PUGE-AT-0042]|nr:hypothetical protein BKA70DRAFT_1337348 [Coprinopsis sp. MPI-PUGE-AT-0042]
MVPYIEQRSAVCRVCLMVMNLPYGKYRYGIFALVEAATVCATVVKARHHMKVSNSPWLVQLYRNGIYSVSLRSA